SASQDKVALAMPKRRQVAEGRAIEPYYLPKSLQLVLVASASALGLFASNDVKAQQPSVSSTQQDGAASAGGEGGRKDDTGQDFTNPQNLFQLRYQYKTAPGTDLNGNNRKVTTDTLTLRSDFTFDLGSPWKVVFRTDLPLVAKDPISSDHPSGDYL